MKRKFVVTTGIFRGFMAGEIVSLDDIGGDDLVQRHVDLNAVREIEPEMEPGDEVETAATEPEIDTKPTTPTVPESTVAEPEVGVGVRELPGIKRGSPITEIK